VDLGTGLFVQSKTDLFLPDIIPINLTRTYRPGDSLSRAFGIGTTQFYDIFLIGDNNPFTFAELILPDGGRIHYDRISAGTGFIDALYQHTSSPTIFYGSTITFNEAEFAWDLRLKDGMVLVFGAATAATIPGQVALLEIRDRCGNVLRLTRDASFNLTTINSPNGRWIQLNYDSSNRVTQAKDNADRTVNYTYDSLGRLSTIKDGNGGLTTYTYDTSNQMLSIKDARGIVYLANQYDANGRVVKQTFADGATYQFKYTLDTQGNIIETDVTEPRGIVRTVKFQSNGYLISDTRAVGKPEQEIVTYNRQSNTNLVLGVIDPLGNATAYTYDAMANVTSITRLARTSNAVTTSFTYDPQFNQVTSAIDALKHKTSFGYDDTGNVTTVTDPLGHQWTLAYNGAGQPVSLTDPLKNSTQLSYLAGDLVVITDPLGHVLTRTVDGAGRLVALTDAVANTTRYSYDSLSQLIQVVDPLQGVTKFSYNQNGDVLSITDARNNITHYVYDNMDRLVSRTDPLLRKESYSYDLSGNLTQFTDRRGNTIQLGYDGLNRAMSVAFGNGGGTLSYSYDKGNRITKVLDSLFGSIARTYDGLNRLTSENTPQGTVTYTYDAVGKRTSMAVTSQTGVNYSYDQANRLIKIAQGSATVSFTYDAGNRQMALTLPNGVLAAYAYDQASRLTGLTYTRGSATIGSLTYTYDEAGRRTNVGGDLSSTDLPQTIGFATYDVANQLTRLDTAKFTYDADGNLTGDGVNTFTWNTRNQLTQVSASGVPFASFRYDGFGRRQAKTTSGLTTQFLYDHLNVVQEITSTKTNLLTGLRTDQIFTRTDASGVRSFLTDALGSSLALTDANGDIQTQYAYASFGNTVVSGSPSANSFQYTGRENDGTGLYYYRARYYAPGYNRFISEDPLRFVAGDANFYAYTRNSPTNFNDPSGKTGMIVAGNRVQSLSGRKTILSSGLFPVDLFRPLSWGDAMKIFALVSGLKGLYGQDPLHFIKKLPSPEYDPKATLEFPDPISPPPSLDATLEVLEEEGLSLQEVAELEALELEAAEAAELTEILETVAVLALL
jgi:RHS repeat-associated protein